jgi:aldehyde:ferredoxin oxidoreductase
MGSKYGGYMGRYLDVDLSSKTVKDYPVTDEMLELYLGGKGLATRILYDTTPKGVDPMGPDNVLIVNTGPLVGSGASSCNRFNVTTKSPLTGTAFSSNSGGNIGLYLKRAGVDGVIIRGKAEKPTWINIKDGTVEFLDASDLWGLDTMETQDKLPPKTGKMVIGPAGENGVLYAAIISQERAAARGGVGAVMGSKNIKAITASGNAKVPIANPEKFKTDVKKWVKLLQDHPTTGEMMPRFGTSIFVNRCNVTNCMPTHNFKRGTYEKAEEVSGETMVETLLEKNFGCTGCVIKCARQVKLDSGILTKGPEYETLAVLGPNIENADLEKLCELNYKADLMGMDTVSLGNTLGFAMELNEKGMWDNGLEFGKTEGLDKVVEDIAYRRGIGDDLANGVKRLSEKYGGKEFAMQVKGLELPGYEPRGAVGHALGYAVANRGGCHLGGGYMVYVEANGPLTMDPLTTHAKSQFTAFLITYIDAVSVAGGCGFTAWTMFPKQVIALNPSGAIYRILAKSLEAIGPALTLLLRYPRMLAFVPPIVILPHPKALKDLMGMKMTWGRFLEAGERCYMIERLYNIREGITGEQDTLPRRATDELQTASDPKTRVPLSKMLPVFYRAKGLDSRGAPDPKVLKRLGVRA